MQLLLSHSQVNVYNTCQYKWYLRYVEGWSSKTSNEHAEKGSTIHTFLQVWYSTHSHEALQEKLKELMNSVTDPEKVSMVASSYTLTKRYIDEFALGADQKWEILAAEHYFNVDLVSPKGNLFQIQGYIDLIVRVGNNIFIVDHKTVYNRFWSELQVELDSQLTLYAAILPFTEGPWQGLGIDGVIINMIKRYEYKRDVPPIDKLVKRIKSYRMTQEKNNVLVEFGHLVDRIHAHVDQPEPHYSKALNKECPKCEFADSCKVALKGINPEPFLEQTHKKKITNLNDLAIHKEAEFNDD